MFALGRNLQEEPSKSELAEAKAPRLRAYHLLPTLRRSAAARQWKAYVEKCLESINRRAERKDVLGHPRVLRVYELQKLVRIELKDWQGGRKRWRKRWNSSS